MARLWAIKTPLLQTGWSVVWNLQGSGLCIAYLDIIGACVSRFNRESREAECVQMRLHCRIHTADARFANDWSAYGSAQSNRPAFPLRVLYSFQPLCCGIRLPDNLRLKRYRCYVYIVKILSSVIIYSIIDFKSISSGHASPFASPHKLTVAIARVIPVETALNRSDR